MAVSIKDYKAILLKLRAVLTGDVRGLENGACGTEGSGDVSENPAEQATDRAEQEISLGRMESQTREIREIDEALERVRDKTFGICEDCEIEISEKRLAAVPFAKFCVECQAKHELLERIVRGEDREP